MKHALVVGGSGMLSNVSVWLANNEFVVSVIGRNPKKLSKLTEVSSNIVPVIVDYCNLKELRSKLRNSVSQHGKYEIVVAWLHSNYDEIIGIITEENNKCDNRPWELFHVLGSSDSLSDILEVAQNTDKCVYHQIQLGFVVDSNRSRWLTHDEISSGVIQCIETKQKTLLVGTLTPWDQRP